MKTFMIRFGVILFGLLISPAIGIDLGPFFTAPGHSWLAVAEAADSSFTQADRDRMIRLEVKIEEGLKAVNQKIDDGLKAVNQRLDDNIKAINQKIDDGLKVTNQRIDDNVKAINQKFEYLIGLMYVVLSVTMSGMLAIVGFILWDRRTTLAPVVRTTKELEARVEKAEKLELAIRAKAEKDPELKEALRHAGLL
ncbi:MAG: hypothetical protein HQL03_06755 [Nitrospirae bacterium]|nr:hypothetical protein [Nitrospirota bacterium]MBF0592967.1 hypothetical protein [Nitrospirota bacterium]